jgi:hypothetical protein
MGFFVEALNELGVFNYTFEGNEPQNKTEFTSKFKVITGENDNGEAIISSDLSGLQVSWSDISAKMSELQTAEPMRLLREERNKLIAETDWWVLPDQATTQTQLDYRQALRDITNTYTSLADVVWPEKPE